MADHTATLTQHWKDILPPAMPPAINSELVFVSIVLLLLAILVVAFLWQQRPRQSARRALRRYRRQLQSHAVDTRLIAYHTYRAVISGLSLEPGQGHHPGADNDAWTGFYQRLQVCVFAAVPPEREAVQQLIREGLYWLRQPDHAAR